MKAVKTFIIRHKITGEIVTVPSGKSSWKAVGHAKNAWNTFGSNYYYAQHRNLERCKAMGLEPIPHKDWRGRVEEGYFDFPRFDEQDVYEIVELKPESETILGTASALLTECLGRITDRELEERVREFLNKQKETK